MENGTGYPHPARVLQERAESLGLDLDQRAFALNTDERDPLKSFRQEFHYPLKKTLPGVDLSLIDEGDECIYLCGNSLGLQPKGLKARLEVELTKWAEMGAHGHTHGDMPWALCDERLEDDMSAIVGARRDEVALMNGLTVNLHLMMISFYQPTPKRHKILLEKQAFPSDHYAVESQIRLHGYDPASSMVFVQPRKGEDTLRHEDIFQTLEEEGEQIALVMLPGVQYYTGQLLDMEAITIRGHTKGCYVGFDLAHAVGNSVLHLHDWGVDFAVWCTYKYLCSGAGGFGGAFLHKKHSRNDFPKLLGWWSHDMSTRFNMDNEMSLSEGIRGYRISNPSIMMAAALKASLQVFKKTDMSALRDKSKLLTGYMEYLLTKRLPRNDDGVPWVRIITPADPDQRGCQLSVQVSVPVDDAFDQLRKRGVVLDIRRPDVLRLAPCPMYNTFLDVYNFVSMLQDALDTCSINNNSLKDERAC